MKNNAQILFGLSIVATVLAAIDFFGKMDVLNLAGTQWILIGIVFGIYALYFKAKEA